MREIEEHGKPSGDDQRVLKTLFNAYSTLPSNLIKDVWGNWLPCKPVPYGTFLPVRPLYPFNFIFSFVWSTLLLFSYSAWMLALRLRRILSSTDPSRDLSGRGGVFANHHRGRWPTHSVRWFFPHPSCLSRSYQSFRTPPPWRVLSWESSCVVG